MIQKLRVLFSGGILFIAALHMQGQVAASGNNILNMVSLTSQTSVKLEVLFKQLPPAGSVYTIKITDIHGKTTLAEKKLSPSSIIRNENKLVFHLTGLAPVLWTPVNPKLYNLEFRISRNTKRVAEKRQRIGFRFFESKDGKLYLNGKPVFLRGIAINPPARGIPDSIETSRQFAEDYVRFMKSIHVNIIRIPENETWYNVCDELGMMVFGGNYGAAVGNERPPEEYDKGVSWYKNEKFARIASHPSLMIYALTNEVPFTGEIAGKWQQFLSYAHHRLKEWDSTRAYIGNAGYGYGRSGDICDLHRYWGWYYSSPFTFLHIRDNHRIIPFEKGVQPVTFTECVGNYTGPDGRYNLTPAHKNPGSQLNWTGHADGDVQARLADEHQSFTFKQATELFRRLRAINPELSGVFPFTILFYNWHTIKTFIDMDPKPVTEQAKRSYQPVLLSWENWTPHVYAGTVLQPIVHIVNDDDEFADLQHAKLIYRIEDPTRSVVFSDSFPLPTIPYYGTFRKQLSLPVPLTLVSGAYRLTGRIVSNGKLLSENHDRIFIANTGITEAGTRPVREIRLYDPVGTTVTSLERLGIPFKRISSFTKAPATAFLVIGENAADAGLAQQAAAVKKFIQAGGRVLCLRQDSASFVRLNQLLDHPFRNVTMDLDNPVYPPPPRPSRNGYYVNPERRDHPVFNGIEREQLRVWSDYTGWDESKEGFPAIYPVTDGFVLENKEDLAYTAVLANYGVALEGITLAEQFSGKGSILVSGFDLVRRTGLDPVADRMLLNLLAYMGDREQHNRYTYVTDQIIWGDYTSENGLLTGVNSGLLLHSRAVLTGAYSGLRTILTKEGNQFAGQRDGFNTRPGVQYVPFGRRPYGPYILRGFANIPMPVADNDNIGEGTFWCTVPEYKKMSSTLVWNPDKEPQTIHIIVNGHIVSKSISPGETTTVDCPVSSPTLQMTFKGDRRLVLLQTSFK